MRLPLALLVLTLAATSAAAQQPQVGKRPQAVEDVFDAEPPGVLVQTWAQNLDAPWSLVFLPDGRALVSERTGRIRLVERGVARPDPVAMVDSVQGGEQGLFGLALHPRFPNPAYLYAMHTYRDPSGAITNRVIRLVMEGDRARFDRVILGGLPAGRSHDGGRIGFGPDGNLYIATGETFRAELAQDRNSLGGKLLRVTADGAPAPDNPFGASPMATLGHRNIQGLAWHPETGQLFIGEHGPSGEFGLQAWDEINAYRPGANYGWPRVVGAAGNPAYVDPVVSFPGQSVPPSGMTFWKGDLYVATLRSQALLQIRLANENGAWRATSVQRWFARNHSDGVFGRLRDAVVGPDGALYVLTNNRDGRGRPNAGDDKILRIDLAPDRRR